MKEHTIGFAGDHAGYELKEELIRYVMGKGYSVKDFGCYSGESCDYPDYAHPLAESVASGEILRGIAVCSTGNGISITLNRHKGVRSAICMNEEMAVLARGHNDANVCSIPSRYVDAEEAKKIVDLFLDGEFEGGRHEKRVKKIEL